jgi:hypothetical protein
LHNVRDMAFDEDRRLTKAIKGVCLMQVVRGE